MHITPQDIRDMFSVMTPSTKTFLTTDKLMAHTLALLSKKHRCAIVPVCPLIFNAFRVTPIELTRVVLIGNDPPNEDGAANGLAYSVSAGKLVPNSLSNIYASMVHSGLMERIPNHGDLTAWGKQGVLLLNLSLTTEKGRANQHVRIWEALVCSLVKRLIVRRSGTIFIVLGVRAQKVLSPLIRGNNSILLEWAHPSKLLECNRQLDNPANFLYNTVFESANDVLLCRGEKAINWKLSQEDLAIAAREVPKIMPPSTPHPMLKCAAGAIWLFTDGGAIANGKKGCRASSAFYVCFGDDMNRNTDILSSQEVSDKTTDGAIVAPSNNRGELIAILSGLQYLEHRNEGNPATRNIIIISDSEYSIKCIRDYAANWISRGITDKCNMDLIIPAYNLYKKMGKITFMHVNSHKDEPKDRTSWEWFHWKGNDIADAECARILGIAPVPFARKNYNTNKYHRKK